MYSALHDLSDALCGDVCPPADRAREDVKPVEDVGVRVAEDLVDAADVLAGGVDDVPPDAASGRSSRR